MPIYKRCSRCGKRLEVGCVCDCYRRRHKEYDKHYRDKRSAQYYHSKEWERTRAEALQTDGGIDVYMYMTRGEILAADTAHHIIPLRDDWDKRNDIGNLMSLHHDTHSMIEQMYKKDKKKIQMELKEILLEYRKRQG